jgi:hypothetical protein
MQRHQQQFSSVTRFVDGMAIGESIFHLNLVRETPPFKNHHPKKQAVTLTRWQKEMIRNVCTDLHTQQRK